MAHSAARYIADELYWQDDDVAGLSYPTPQVRTNVHNANFLGGGLLCRVYAHTGDASLLQPALRVARYSAARQRPDGSWLYGDAATQAWIDNFHTGFNLRGLQAIGRYAGTAEFEPNIARGYRFYLDHFFTDTGAPRYFHDRLYPIDIHCVADSMITPLALRHRDARSLGSAKKVLSWALSHMWDERGFFWYRISRMTTTRISYMRWSQAWMLYALATMLESGVDVDA
jgi:hypothetical protein